MTSGFSQIPNQKSGNMQINPMLAIFNLGGGEIILILAIVLILFGAKRLPELAKGLGQGIREFKNATDNASAGIRGAEETLPASTRRLPQVPADRESPILRSGSDAGLSLMDCTLKL
jgi:sec-independent protein translocase protein TatA